MWSSKQNRPVLNNWEVFHPAKKFLAFLKPEICCRIYECPPYDFVVMQFIQNFIGCPSSLICLIPCSQDVQSLAVLCMFWRSEFHTSVLFNAPKPYQKRYFSPRNCTVLKRCFFNHLCFCALFIWTAQQVVFNLLMCLSLQILYEIELGPFKFWVRSLSARSVKLSAVLNMQKIFK